MGSKRRTDFVHPQHVSKKNTTSWKRLGGFADHFEGDLTSHSKQERQNREMLLREKNILGVPSPFFPGILLSKNYQNKNRQNGRCLKRTTLEKNGEEIQEINARFENGASTKRNQCDLERRKRKSIWWLIVDRVPRMWV